MKYCFMYAGQGSQKVGMGKDFYEEYPICKRLVDSQKLSFNHKEIMWEGPAEVLSQTEYTQPLMGLFAAEVTEVLKEHGIMPDYALGLSLGEYGALYAAGTFSLEEYLQVLAYRGSAMAEAAKGSNCAMSAILGAESEIVKEACDSYEGEGYVTVANYNCPGQYVICGDEEAVAAVEADLKTKGGKRCIRLAVSGPFHTRFMKSAGEKLAQLFEGMELKAPKIPVVLNYTGDFWNEEESLSDMLVAQVQNSVQLEASLMKMLEEDVDCYVEIGPGNTMTGFLRKCAKKAGKKVTVKTIETVENMKAFLEEYR